MFYYRSYFKFLYLCSWNELQNNLNHQIEPNAHFKWPIWRHDKLQNWVLVFHENDQKLAFTKRVVATWARESLPLTPSLYSLFASLNNCGAFRKLPSTTWLPKSEAVPAALDSSRWAFCLFHFCFGILWREISRVRVITCRYRTQFLLQFGDKKMALSNDLITKTKLELL